MKKGVGERTHPKDDIPEHYDRPRPCLITNHR
jgi:hypothetical protein